MRPILDEAYAAAHRRGFFGVAVYNPKREENVGAVIRVAHCFGASILYVFGQRFRRYNSDTTNGTCHVPTLYIPDPALFWDYMPEHASVVALEITDGTDSLVRFCHPGRAVYVLGPEDGSLPSVVLDRAHHLVRVPTQFCLNVAHALTATLYDRTAKGSA